MADKTYKSLKDKNLSLSIKINSAEKAVKNYKKMAEDPSYSKAERSSNLESYKKAVEKLAELKAEYSDTEKSLKKIEGEGALQSIKDRYAALKEELSLQIDPDSESAKKIEKEIEDLVPRFQSAYSDSVGARVSKTVAKSKLFGTKIATLNNGAQGGAESTGVESVGTAVSGENKPAASSKPAAKEKTTKDVYSKTRGAGSKTEATTRNPVTGETIKVSDIKPANGAKPVPVVTGPNALPPVDREAAADKIVTGADFGLSEALFKNIPSLKIIFDQYTDPKSGMTDDEFRKLIRQDVWYKQNSKEIKNRFVQFYNYQDLKNSGQATGKTDYEKQIATIESALKKRAVQLGSAAASDPVALRKAAENLYLTDRSDDQSFIDDFLASAIRPVSGMIGGKVTEGYSGQALKDYNALLQTARNNGFKISDILPGGQNEQQVLGAIARGEIDINRVAQDARKLAAQGQPQYVRDLLSQGYDLAQVFQPYRQTMANVLEIGDPNQIDLNDPLLRTAITDKGDMNLYDFKKALRQDNRWQYTEQAKQDVSNAALGVLRDFGFQG